MWTSETEIREVEDTFNMYDRTSTWEDGYHVRRIGDFDACGRSDAFLVSGLVNLRKEKEVGIPYMYANLFFHTKKDENFEEMRWGISFCRIQSSEPFSRIDGHAENLLEVNTDCFNNEANFRMDCKSNSSQSVDTFELPFSRNANYVLINRFSEKVKDNPVEYTKQFSLLSFTLPVITKECRDHLYCDFPLPTQHNIDEFKRA